jgi:hypothetical protein
MIQTVDDVKFTSNAIRIIVIRFIQLTRHDKSCWVCIIHIYCYTFRNGTVYKTDWTQTVDEVKFTSNAIHFVMIQLT